MVFLEFIFSLAVQHEGPVFFDDGLEEEEPSEYAEPAHLPSCQPQVNVEAKDFEEWLKKAEENPPKLTY